MKIIIPTVESILNTNKFCSEMNNQKSVVLDIGEVVNRRSELSVCLNVTTFLNY
jgi:hypothetical protein